MLSPDNKRLLMSLPLRAPTECLASVSLWANRRRIDASG
jgi:hypothetical protein